MRESTYLPVARFSLLPLCFFDRNQLPRLFSTRILNGFARKFSVLVAVAGVALVSIVAWALVRSAEVKQAERLYQRSALVEINVLQ